MQNSLLFHTLAAFTAAERREIALFLRNGFFNRGKHPGQIVQLFNLLVKAIEQDDKDSLRKEHLSATLSPGKKFSAGYLDNLMHELLELLRKYILVTSLTGKPMLEAVSARFYRDRGLEIQAKQALARLNSLLAAQPALDFNTALFHLWSSLETVLLESLHNRRQGDLALPDALQALGVFFSSQLLNLSAQLYQQQRYIHATNTDWNGFIEGFRTLLRERNYLDQPALEVMEQALLLIRQPCSDPEETVRQYLDLVHRQEAAFPVEMLKNLATLARTFCSNHLQPGNLAFMNLYLSLYQDHLQRGWLYENGRIHPSYLINMVTIGMRAGQSQWVWEVLSTHRGRVTDDEDECIWQYCLASYHFYLGNLAEADKFVLKQKPKDIQIEKSMRILGIKVAFERNPQSEHLDSQLQAFSMYLSRNQNRLTPEKHRQDTRFIAAVRKMARPATAHQPIYRKQIAALRQTLNNPDYEIAERNWLLEKTEAL